MKIIIRAKPIMIKHFTHNILILTHNIHFFDKRNILNSENMDCIIWLIDGIILRSVRGNKFTLGRVCPSKERCFYGKEICSFVRVHR